MIGKQYQYYIGIDTGVNTGFAMWSRATKTLTSVETLSIHKAMERVKGIVLPMAVGMVLVRVEDARKRKVFGETGREKLQGAGSIKRDAKIWEDFLTDLKVDFEMVAPRNNKTKLNAATFKQMTRFTKETNEHGRDAAMLVFGF